MLNIYTDVNLTKDKTVVAIPWRDYFNKQKITKYFDKSDAKIVADVEETSMLNNETIQGKFSDMPIGIGCLSDGCKALLCINHAIKTSNIEKYVFDITSCGGNAVAYLANEIAKDVDVYTTINHTDLGFDKYVIKINNRYTCKDTISAVNIFAKLRNGVDVDGN